MTRIILTLTLCVLSAAAHATRECERLELYELSDLKYLGALVKDGVNTGKILTPGNVTYMVKEGNYVGKDFGQVITITNDFLLINEVVMVNKSTNQYKKVTNYLVRDGYNGEEATVTRSRDYQWCIQEIPYQ